MLHKLTSPPLFLSKNKMFLIALFSIMLSSLAQQKDRTSSTDTITNYSAYKRKLSFAGVLQTRYVYSLTKDADVDGKNFDANTTKGITNTFMLKRARVMLKTDINDHFSANVLVNFAEFNDNPSNKVLENAYIKYKLNPYFSLQAGQFRPFFGIEDVVPVDIIRTLDFSNQYYAFGKNGWQSFQIGVSIFGNIVPSGRLRYYAGAYNGNNKNQKKDNNNTKNTYLRLETDVAKTITIGANIARGNLGESGIGNAYGIDFTGKINFSEKWQLLLMTEGKTGTNFLAYMASNSDVNQVIKPSINEFKMQGFYLLPTLRYDCKNRRLRAIEFSSRYEYFDENYKIDNNIRQTLIPNLSLIFADDFYAALQMGVSIDIYKKSIPLTTTNSNSLAYVQLQVRF
ncbi:porin [Flavobacterium sp. Fl-77]|uniref:Porin n=1 Tax=Flavobacterium flavipigmentatum TaxID=2893884 RepID=A0AAJ2SEG8_9FLAO|nr:MULTISPECIES: porin [unclassified Flavobacterium]MDX6182914.1 porin [Flavobacterium sp. Fl-33]MDX6186367.1 porin [Flavobacterium sp. Fl-77]UFH37846.1 OprO/OprP family phosphate-selective porin [Flavobacterium sp. F-70]